MPAYVALLRAVNVGGTGKLAMTGLKAICEAAGFRHVETYIASGNVVFLSDASEAEVKRLLETGLAAHTGRATGVLVRTAAEVEAVAATNPFPDAPNNRVVAIFLDTPAVESMLQGVAGMGPDEEIRLGEREIYVRYGEGMGRSRLRIAAARTGTARNLNTVATLARMASTLVGAKSMRSLGAAS